MSAYVVAKHTIDRVVCAFRMVEQETGRNFGAVDNPNLVGECLWLMNERAVQYRYSGDPKMTPLREAYHFEPPKNDPPIQMYKAMCCLLYQCSEGDTPNDVAYGRLEMVKVLFGHHFIIRETDGWAHAEWG